MESNDLITVVLSVLSVVLSGVFGVRTTRLAHTLDPKRRYTARFELQPIELDYAVTADGPKPA